MEQKWTQQSIIAALLLIAGMFAVCFALLLINGRRQKQMAQQINRLIKEAVQNLHLEVTTLEQMISAALPSFMQRDEAMQQFHMQTQQTLSQMNELSRTELARFDAMDQRLDSFMQMEEHRIRSLTAMLDEKLMQSQNQIEKMRETLEKSISSLQMENSKKLDEMRQTVDEKLHATLEKRLSESFQVVSRQLDQVSKGLGEMRSLATGVGDLKRVLTNVKTRGVWGEMQLGMLLEQVLAKNQYEENVAVSPLSSQRVEYAVRLPGQGEETVYLPIDAKFPVEDYERLLSAEESDNPDDVKTARKALEDAIRTEAKRISSKYIDPPHTTDFAIMFLPTEGLYAEALRSRGLAEELQEKHRIMVAGPTTLTALLTSLQVGFKTLAIEKRSGEVWKLLSAVRTDFSRFAELLDAAQKKLRSASDSIETATSRSRTIERKLRHVEKLDTGEAVKMLENEEDFSDQEE